MTNKAKVKIETQQVDSNLANTDEVATSRRREVRTKRVSREEIVRLYRNPFALSDRFGVKDDEEFVYRVVHTNSPYEPHRLSRYEKLGYVVKNDDQIKGERMSSDPAPFGANPGIHTGKGEEFVVMQIPRALYEENQLLKREAHKSNYSVDGNNQSQKVREFLKNGERELVIDGGIIDDDTPLHSNIKDPEIIKR